MLTRREMLFGGAMLASATLVPKFLESAYAGRQRYVVASVGEKNKGRITIMSLQTGGTRSVHVGFEPHSFLQHPRYPNRIWAVEKWGVNVVELDVAEGKVIQRIVCSGDKQFYGHGFFAADGSTLFVVRVDTHTGLGHLAGYDTTSYRQIEDYQVTIGGLHDSQLLPDGTLLLTSSGTRKGAYDEGKPALRLESSSLVYVDLQGGKVLDKAFIRDDTHVIGHFSQAAGGRLVVLSSPVDRISAPHAHGHIYMGSTSGTQLQQLHIDAATGPYEGEMLSVAVNRDASMALVTNPVGRRIIVLDPRSATHITTLMIEAHGVAYDGARQQFIASTPHGIIAIAEGASANISFAMQTLVPQKCSNAHNLVVEI